MVIVTKRCFVVAERINYVSVEEENEGSRTKRKIRYQVIIHYTPKQNPNNSNSRHENESCSVYTYNKKVAEDIYRDIVDQYREQNPDELYLDKVVAALLEGVSKQ
jgi:hypothetical protein